jgi:hypothetical protein
MVEKTLLMPPHSQFGPISNTRRHELIARSPLAVVYEQDIDRESAYELLQQRAEAIQAKREAANSAPVETTPKPRARRRSNRQSIGEAFAKSVARSIGSAVGRKIVRGILGSIIGGR